MLLSGLLTFQSIDLCEILELIQLLLRFWVLIQQEFVSSRFNAIILDLIMLFNQDAIIEFISDYVVIDAEVFLLR